MLNGTSRRSRRPVLITVAALATLAALAACSSGADSSGAMSAAGGSGHGVAGAPAAASLPSASAAGTTAAGASFAGKAAGGAAQDASASLLPATHDLVYTAQLTVRARNVSAALSTATSIVTAADGYVSDENSAGQGAGEPASSATTTVTLKIPAAVYPGTLARLAGPGLGSQLSLRQQAQDVTQQVADVSSLVTSDQAAIAQLRALLKDAGSVGDLLSVQDQINAETSNLESMLAQQQALDHETAYATVTLTLVGPKAAVKPRAKRKPAPPPGLASGLSGGWRAFRLTLDWLLAVIGAVAPFAAVLVVIAGAAWWVRRRITGRPAGRATGADS